MQPPTLRFLLSIAFATTTMLAAGCASTHSQAIASGAYDVQFHTGAMLASPQTSTGTIVENGHELIVETSVLPYEKEGFENRQLVATLRGKNGEALHVDEGVYRGTLSAFAAELAARGGAEGSIVKCEDAVPASEAPADLAGWMMRCSRSQGNATQTVAVRVLSSPRVLVVQAGSFTSDWGRDKTRAFFHSLRRGDDPKPASTELAILTPAILQKTALAMTR